MLLMCLEEDLSPLGLETPAEAENLLTSSLASTAD